MASLGCNRNWPTPILKEILDRANNHWQEHGDILTDDLARMRIFVGPSLLLRAAYVNDEVFLRRLIECGYDPKTPDAIGNTAVSYAAYGNAAKTLVMLKNAGVSVNACNKYGETPLLYAVRGKSR